MENSPIGKWFPFYIDWFMRASASWEDAWAMPTLRLLSAMWPKGMVLEDRDEVLARTARVSLKAWLDMRREMGDFWAVVDGKFTQPFLAAEYLVAVEKASKRSEKASKGGKAKQEKAQERLARELAAAAASSSASGGAPSSASSTASSTSPSISQALLEPHTRAGSVFSSRSEEEREDQYASAVPKPEYVEACFRAYPRERRGKAAANRAVAIPADARERIALFLLRNPGYRLLEVWQAVAKTCDIPPSMADFLDSPWDAESTIRAAQGKGTGTGQPSGKTPFLEQQERERAREEEEWNNLTEAEQQERLRASERSMGMKYGNGR